MDACVHIPSSWLSTNATQKRPQCATKKKNLSLLPEHAIAASSVHREVLGALCANASLVLAHPGYRHTLWAACATNDVPAAPASHVVYCVCECSAFKGGKPASTKTSVEHTIKSRGSPLATTNPMTPPLPPPLLSPGMNHPLTDSGASSSL